MTLLVVSGTTLVLALLGVTLLVGFGADWLATRFRIPDVLWLIALGILAGPILGLLSSSSLLTIAPLLGTAALVLILFDAGIDLKVTLLRPLAGSAVLFAVLSYFLSTAVLFAAGLFALFPGHWVRALLFAASLGCVSGAVIIPLANRLQLPAGLRSLLHLDGAIEDALAVVTVTTLLSLIGPSRGDLVLTVTVSVVLPLPVGILIGIAAGLLWLLFLYGWQDRPFATLATLGFLFAIYAVTEALGGSGILAAIVFGMILGNEAIVRRLLRRVRPFRISRELRRVEVEIAFLLRTFFLFLIGMLVTLSSPGLETGVVIVGIVVILLGMRRLIVPAVSNPKTVPRAWASPVASLYGRGLTSAVLLIISLGEIPSAANLFLPALLVIVGTNIAMTVMLFLQPPIPGAVAPEVDRVWASAAPEIIALSSEEPLTAPTPTPSSESTPDESPAPSAPAQEPPPLPRPRDRRRP